MFRLVQSLVNRWCVDVAPSVGASPYTRCCKCYGLVAQELLLGYSGAGLRLVLPSRYLSIVSPTERI